MTTASARCLRAAPPGARSDRGVERQDPRARQSVPRRVAGGELREARVDLDEIGARRALRLMSASPTAPTPAPTSTTRPCAASPPPPRAGRRPSRHDVRSSAGERQPTAKPRVTRQAVRSPALPSCSDRSGIAQFVAQTRLVKEATGPGLVSPSTRIRRGKKPSEPSTAAICWSARKNPTPSAFRSDSITLMSTRSFVRRISTNRGPQLGALAPSVERLYGRPTGSGKGKRPVGVVVPLEDQSVDRLIQPLMTLVADDMGKVNRQFFPGRDPT